MTQLNFDSPVCVILHSMKHKIKYRGYFDGTTNNYHVNLWEEDLSWMIGDITESMGEGESEPFVYFVRVMNRMEHMIPVLCQGLKQNYIVIDANASNSLETLVWVATEIKEGFGRFKLRKKKN